MTKKCVRKPVARKPLVVKPKRSQTTVPFKKPQNHTVKKRCRKPKILITNPTVKNCLTYWKHHSPTFVTKVQRREFELQTQGRPTVVGKVPHIRKRRWGKWIVEIRVSGIGKNPRWWIGTFPSELQAAIAREMAFEDILGIAVPSRHVQVIPFEFDEEVDSTSTDSGDSGNTTGDWGSYQGGEVASRRNLIAKGVERQGNTNPTAIGSADCGVLTATLTQPPVEGISIPHSLIEELRKEEMAGVMDHLANPFGADAGLVDGFFADNPFCSVTMNDQGQDRTKSVTDQLNKVHLKELEN